ncbi:MAG: carbon-nitrogen hydrolase, partial [Candidatus Heimdallarchaeota archaeon]|nr:carbon-nitrogen hydrolase [Candidatus Heimdallarchaeota archaeon]
QASTDKEEIHTVEIDITKARNKWLSDNNHIFNDRRPEMYSKIVDSE